MPMVVLKAPNSIIIVFMQRILVTLFFLFIFTNFFLIDSQVFSQSAQGEIWVVPIEGEITPVTAKLVRSRIEKANSTIPQPTALVLLIDTPGGRIDAMEKIADSILRDAFMPTIAVVENAYSAGALIAMSAESLVMLPGSAIGAALPVTLNPTTSTGLSPAEEKINSAVREKFVSVAQARGRNEQVAEAMVNPRIEVPGLATDKELVTLSAADAVEQNIADLEATNLHEALRELGYGNANIVRLSPSATEHVALWLTRPLIAAILLAVGIIGILLEIFIPGFGLPGILGTLALLLFFGGTLVASPTGIWDIALVLLALILIALELFIIPGFGVAGVLGIAILGYATWRIFEGDAVSAFAYTTIFGGCLLTLLLWLFYTGRLGKFLVLSEVVSNNNKGSKVTTNSAPLEHLSHLVEKEGLALSDLRPAGIALINNERIDVVTQGDFINADTPIKVLRIEGNRVIVRVL